jgi:hypothetical protein
MIKIDTAPLSGMTLSLLALAGLESSAESPDGGWAHKSARNSMASVSASEAMRAAVSPRSSEDHCDWTWEAPTGTVLDGALPSPTINAPASPPTSPAPSTPEHHSPP